MCIGNKFPNSWKIARVTSLPKKYDLLNYSDLRPFSILPCLSKVLEKVMNKQIKCHLEQYLILSENQSGFRAGYSCPPALINITYNILREIGLGNCTALV